MTYSILDDASFWKFEVELPQLNLTDEILSRNFNTLSPGEQTKILLALMFVEEGTFKLIDEPTNHLDITGRDIVANYLKRKSGFIVVSHDKTMINQTVNHVLSIDRSKIQLLKGNYDTWENKFKQDNLSEAKQNFKLNKQIKNLQQTAERLNGWSNRAENEKYAEFYKGQHHVYIDKGFLGHKAAKLMKRSKNALRRVESSIEEKQGLLQNIDKNPKLTLNYEPFYHDNILTVNQLVLERCNRALVQNPISFNIKQGQQLVISGSNGTGKSSLLQAIRGQLSIVKSGKIAKSRGLKVSYLEQSFAEVRGSMLEYTQSYQIDLLEMLNMLKKLGFERFEFGKDLADLSMGQKRKITLARFLCERANLYIWDEPLNYLDVMTRQQIQELILTVKPPMIIVDHDRDFIKSIKASQYIELV
ncbi:ATP-binding cassette domain-containing protein [Holzapfeliella floricola]|uniref:ATP-binding cassette domain-containing protein n=1 Tax=Holzapfeliella floricola TaxID=679249 RepID=UPI00078306D3|nr:ATP-binding cassette domain-containing protein [Holzapfeliella floricola]